jgi:hypothetical protein
LAFWFFAGREELQAEILAGGILERPLILAKYLLRIRVALGNDLPVTDIGAKYVKVSVQESTFSLVEHVERFGLICLHGCFGLQEHGLSLFASAVILTESCWRERNDCA